MKIEYDKGNPFRMESYKINIEESDNAQPLEIGECFKNQYPKKKAIILFSRVVHNVEIGMLIVGLNLRTKARQLNKRGKVL